MNDVIIINGDYIIDTNSKMAPKHPKNISSSGKRKRRKPSANPMKQSCKESLAFLDKGSFYEQESCEIRQKIANGLLPTSFHSSSPVSTGTETPVAVQTPVSGSPILTPASSLSDAYLTPGVSAITPTPFSEVSSQSVSATPSEKKECRAKVKLDWAREQISSDDSDIELETGIQEDEQYMQVSNLWIMDISLLSNALEAFVCCNRCQGKISILEDVNCRAGLGTRLRLVCENEKCLSQAVPAASFDTTKKSGKKYDINTTLVIANRLIGRGHSASVKFCATLGLAQPVTDDPWRAKSLELLGQ